MTVCSEYGRCTHPVPHGTYSGYTRHGCRCDGCREAARIYRRRYRTRSQFGSGKCVDRHETCPHVDLEHGTMTSYTGHGCRCDPCRAFWRRYVREIRARNRIKARRDPSTVPHGTTYGYQSYGCRCRECKLAMSVTRRNQYARGRQRRDSSD